MDFKDVKDDDLVTIYQLVNEYLKAIEKEENSLNEGEE